MADVANIDVTIVEDNDAYCVYQADMIHTGGAEDDITSQAMYIGFSDGWHKPGAVHVEYLAGSAANDVHIYLGGLMDNDLSAADFGVLDTSLDIDGPNINRSTLLHWRTSVNTLTESSVLINSQTFLDYLVIKSDGQTSNPATASNRVTIKVWKDPNFPKQYKAHVKDTV